MNRGDGSYRNLTVRRKLELVNPLRADIIGSLTGDVTGDVVGNVHGSVVGDVKAKRVVTDKLQVSSISNNEDGLGLTFEGVRLQKGRAECNRINVTGFVQTNEILEFSENNGVKIDGVQCKDNGIMCNNVRVGECLHTGYISGVDPNIGVFIEGVQIKQGKIMDVEQTQRKGKAGGYCELDANGKIPNSRLSLFPWTMKGAYNPITNVPKLTTVGKNPGDCYIVVENGKSDIHEIGECNQGDIVLYDTAGRWNRITVPSLITSVNGQVGKVELGMNDFRFTTESGDLMVDDGRQLSRLPRGQTGQFLGISENGEMLEWQNTISGCSVDFCIAHKLFDNVPCKLGKFTLTRPGSFNDVVSFDLEGGSFKVPSTGRYHVNVCIDFEQTKFKQTTRLDLILNNDDILAQDICKSCAEGFGLLKLSITRELRQGDVLNLNVLQVNQGGESISVGESTFPSFVEISKIR